MSVLAARSLTEVLVSLGSNAIVLVIAGVVLLLLPGFIVGAFQGLRSSFKDDLNYKKNPIGYFFFCCFLCWVLWRFL
jgi:hypothetical protein